MVSSRQRKQIKEKMRAVKEARKSGADKRVIEQRANELMQYLYEEGIIQQPDE